MTLQQVPTRRERKKLETRQALEHAALRLFATRGYEQTTVEDIADAADVAVRTFFRYYSSKQDVLFGDVANDRIGRLRLELAARPCGEPVVDAVTAVLDSLDLTDDDERRQILARLDLLRDQPSLRTQYLELIDSMASVVMDFVALRTNTDPRTDMYPHLVASAASASWNISLTLWAASGGRDDLGALRQHAFALFCSALPPAPVAAVAPGFAESPRLGPAESPAPCPAAPTTDRA
jgi:AcrR family transcriptional regulator